MVFSDEQRASIDQYAAENSTAAALKKFKQDFGGNLGESTVRLFKKRYLAEVKKAKQNAPEEVPKVTKVAKFPWTLAVTRRL